MDVLKAGCGQSQPISLGGAAPRHKADAETLRRGAADAGRSMPPAGLRRRPPANGENAQPWQAPR